METSKRKKAAAPEIDIGQETRMELYRLQLELRYCEKRARTRVVRPRPSTREPTTRTGRWSVSRGRASEAMTPRQ